ncbi:cellulase family glycosylhydrolase [Cohnella herbarum]|uniref:Endoglucanase n=1 Tax=Cohnella herbarum TaxID=2728023 RepID=A0A7Z2VQ33_9BACL|nr:cellulase family glycosylhydrolase [Cohnella herbarum]QJD87159.1 cellulase family glycosylhydrolase [Cohnella herbarum]
MANDRLFKFNVPLVLILLLISFLLPLGNQQSHAAGTVPFGQLKVTGNKLTNSAGQAVQLVGMSSHGLQWYGNYVNKPAIQWMKENWGINVFRAALYTAEDGYITTPSLKEKVKEAVQAAIDLGIYVIIDWHILSDGNPNTYKTQAISFFQEMATLYGNTPNVIYEIANEPNGSVSWNDVKSYANEVVPAIRAIDPDGIVIVGSPMWSQDIHSAADSPLAYSNIMYSLHFYAGTHGQSLRDRITYAMGKGAAIFVTEWGTSDASGNGGPYLTQAKEWIDFLNANKVSWVNWSLADKAESSAALVAGAPASGGWTDAQLTTSGKWVRDQIRAATNNGGNPTVPAAPTGITATAGNAQAALNWTASSGATSYAVKRATTSGGPYASVATGITATSYTNTGLTNGTTYYYVVSASNTAGASANSAQVSVTPQAASTGGGLIVQYKAGDANAGDNQIKPHLNIKNSGTTAVSLSNVKVRYYFTKDGTAVVNAWIDWAQVGSSNVQTAFGSATGIGADTYVELSFAAGAGSLAPNAQTGDIQLRMTKADWSNFNETGDYSYDPTKTAYADWNKVTLYVNGTLAWGTAP